MRSYAGSGFAYEIRRLQSRKIHFLQRIDSPVFLFGVSDNADDGEPLARDLVIIDGDSFTDCIFLGPKPTRCSLVEDDHAG